MRLISDDASFDLVGATERAERWETIRHGFKIGLITADNFTPQDRQDVRAFFAQLPLIEATDARLGTARIIGEADLREGWEWCFATSAAGVFGVFALDEPSRSYLDGAVLHLWVPRSSVSSRAEERLDFTDISDYQDHALEAALAA